MLFLLPLDLYGGKVTRLDSKEVVSLAEWQKANSIGKTTAYAFLNIVKARQITIKMRRRGGASKPSPLLAGEVLAAMNALLCEYQNGISIATLEQKYGSITRSPHIGSLEPNVAHAESFAIYQGGKKNQSKNSVSASGFVYYVRWENDPLLVKIGYTANLKNRFSSFLTCSPHRLEILRIEETTDSHLEKALHARFDDYRMAGEWFKYEGDLERHITSLDVGMSADLLSLDAERIIVHCF
jgi:hypothetical protein